MQGWNKERQSVRLKLKPARDKKGNKKGYFKYISSEKLTKETLGLLFKEAGNLVRKGIQKVKLLRIALISEVRSQASQVLESSV